MTVTDQTRSGYNAPNYTYRDEEQFNRPILRGVYPLWSEMQHSCTPNVAAYATERNELMLVVVRPVRRGAALTVDRAHGMFGNDGRAIVHHGMQRAEGGGGEQCYCPPPEEEQPYACDTSPLRLMGVFAADHEAMMGQSLRCSVNWEQWDEVWRLFVGLAMKMQLSGGLYPCRELWDLRQRFDECLARLLAPRSWIRQFEYCRPPLAKRLKPSEASAERYERWLERSVGTGEIQEGQELRWLESKLSDMGELAAYTRSEQCVPMGGFLDDGGLAMWMMMNEYAVLDRRRWARRRDERPPRPLPLVDAVRYCATREDEVKVNWEQVVEEEDGALVKTVVEEVTKVVVQHEVVMVGAHVVEADAVEEVVNYLETAI